MGQIKAGNCRLGFSWALGALFIPATLLLLTSRGALSRQKMAQTAMSQATDTAAGQGPSFTDILPGLQAVADFLASEHAHVWLLSVVGSVAVGLSGIFPLLVIPTDAGVALKTQGKEWYGEDKHHRCSGTKKHLGYRFGVWLVHQVLKHQEQGLLFESR